MEGGVQSKQQEGRHDFRPASGIFPVVARYAICLSNDSRCGEKSADCIMWSNREQPSTCIDMITSKSKNQWVYTTNALKTN